MVYEGSYEDYIYILIGIIWIAYSFYKSASKAKASKTTGGTPAEEPASGDTKNFLEKFFDELADQDQQPAEFVPEEQPAEETVTKPTRQEEIREEKFFSYDDEYEKSNFNEVADVYDKTTETNLGELRKKAESKLKPGKISPKIDLRKAVIYSEILHPKYF